MNEREVKWLPGTHHRAAVRLHNWLPYLFSAPLVGQTERARLFGFSTISPSERSDLTCRDGPMPSTDRPCSHRRRAKTIRGCRDSTCARMFPSGHGDGGGFRMNSQPCTNRPLPSDSLRIETKDERHPGDRVARQRMSTALLADFQCQGDTSPCTLLGTP